MIIARRIELLSPAKDLNCGLEAVKHGADAVYIGAPKFSARSAAGNSIDDIKELCDFAHVYNVRVYVALNTILKDEELGEAEKIINQVYKTGADALVIQDFGIMRLDIPPIPLHASTQMDNRTPEQVKFLNETGFSQIVLARELSIGEIERIHSEVPEAKLEAFVHGALCVCLSGKCYLSAAITGRSANRGECAQCCRLPYSLEDADGKKMITNKHLLSLKDLNLSDDLEAMMNSGVSSFKIEGRLKDVAYVKNITAFYRKKLDRIFEQNPAYYRSSVGNSSYTFKPQADKSFNRGFTSYFAHGRGQEITSSDTPKSIGEPIGMVKEIKGNTFIINSLKVINNGDGLVFINPKGELEGFRVNKAEVHRIFPKKLPDTLRQRTLLYRNFDKQFEDTLAKPSAERKIKVKVELTECISGFSLIITDETDAKIMIVKDFDKKFAKILQRDNIRTQLTKLGNTPFESDEIIISLSNNYFIPSSVLSEMRREAVDKLIKIRKIRYKKEYFRKKLFDNAVKFPVQHLDYTANVYNIEAQAFYAQHGATVKEFAFEMQPVENVPLMFTKYCLKFGLGWCPVLQKNKSPYKEPFYLINNGNRLKLTFDCKRCMMVVELLKFNSIL
ncbi:MAG: U32 family peptidase [Tannerella sp.]|jgi:putative protease|nr:U32 family peptidase [Tannerella sp.]